MLIINSLPKSGTHLIATLLNEMGFCQREQFHFSRSLIRRDFFMGAVNAARGIKNNLFGGFVDVSLDHELQLFPMKTLRHYISGLSNNEYIEGHLPYSSEINNFFVSEGVTMINVIRNPIDVLLSYYEHVSKDNHYPANKYLADTTIDQIWMRLLDGDEAMCIPSLELRLQKYEGWLKTGQLLIRFENLIGEKGGGTRQAQELEMIKIANHLGLSPSVNELARLSDKIFDRKSETFNRGIIGRGMGQAPDPVKERLAAISAKFGYAISD